MHKNPFLVDLLQLQQDGAGAISAPSNWMAARPLLEVPTELDAVVDELLVSGLSRDGENALARWHFFVGSPGNGKSAATGQLSRKLVERGCRILTEDKEEISALGSGDIPYLLHVYEGANPYSTLWIAQDASVVRDPYSAASDPALEFIVLLKQAYERRVSLVICTNRGVIEKAFRQVYQDPIATAQPWFKAMKLAVDDKPSQTYEFAKSQKRGFENFRFTHTKLDRRSLVIGSTTFGALIQKATAAEHWAACSGCPAQDECPFYLNRGWLSDEKASKHVIDLLKRSELFSGQIIVFREALALLSFLLAGCPRDYGNGDPCSWVQARQADGDLFALLFRRIYMGLFSAYAPYALEPEGPILELQMRALEGISQVSGSQNDHSSRALKWVTTKGRAPSPDAGVKRLLGRDGVFHRLDALNDPLGEKFISEWDGAIKGYEAHAELCSSLEKQCLNFWETYLEELENRPIAGAMEYKWLRRWITAYSYRFGALATGRTAYNDELAELTELAAFVGATTTPALLPRLLELQKELRRMLGESSAGVQVSEFVRLVGEWPGRELAPKVELSDKADRLSLMLKFPQAVEAYLPAEVYIWLSRLLKFHMSRASFPIEHLEAARDALVRAAVRSDYSTTDDIEIRIELPARESDAAGPKQISVQRVNGVVVVDEAA